MMMRMITWMSRRTTRRSTRSRSRRSRGIIIVTTVGRRRMTRGSRRIAGVAVTGVVAGERVA